MRKIYLNNHRFSQVFSTLTVTLMVVTVSCDVYDLNRPNESCQNETCESSLLAHLPLNYHNNLYIAAVQTQEPIDVLLEQGSDTFGDDDFLQNVAETDLKKLFLNPHSEAPTQWVPGAALKDGEEGSGDGSGEDSGDGSGEEEQESSGGSGSGSSEYDASGSETQSSGYSSSKSKDCGSGSGSGQDKESGSGQDFGSGSEEDFGSGSEVETGSGSGREKKKSCALQ